MQSFGHTSAALLQRSVIFIRYVMQHPEISRFYEYFEKEFDKYMIVIRRHQP
jgi:hypothetical protein